jgi:hypothetical protein
MKKYPRVLPFSIVTALYALVPSHSHAEITIITPPGLEDVEGGSRDTLNPGGFRSQELRPAAWFRDSLPPGGAWLVGVRDRADASQQQNVTVRYNDMKITASTTQRDSISTNFAANVGTDAVEVFDGAITLSYEVDSNAPNPLSGMWKFTTPFFYDPDKGNLLLDYVSNSGLDRSYTIDSAVVAPARVNVGRPNAQSADSLLTDLIVTQFVFQVPEPASALLLLLSTPAFLGRYGRKG